MIEIKIVKNDKGEEEVIIPVEHNMGKLYRISKDNDLVITFGNKVIKQLMLESVQNWARRNYSVSQIVAECKDAFDRETLEENEDYISTILDVINRIDYEKEKERNDAIKLQMEQYAQCSLLEILDITHYPIRIDENNNVLGFEKGEEVKIIE